MRSGAPHHTLDALIATLEAARTTWHEVGSRKSAHRIGIHAAETGVIDGNWEKLDDLDRVDELIARLRAIRSSEIDPTTILIVEDDRLTARVLADALTSEGRTVLIAGSARQAEKLLREHDIAIILLDLVLPDGDGRDFLTRIRMTPATRGVPVIVITARKDAVSQAECFALGADALLAKPVQPTVLIAAVSAQLAHAMERRLEGREDGLTGLANRVAFMDALERTIPLAQRNNQPLALAMIDLDHFKAVNDSHGHAAGDQVLRACAQTIGKMLRSSDYVARWGGEELCAFFPDTSAHGAVRAMEKALAAVRALEFRSGATTYGITFSAGVAAFQRGATAADLLEEADRLLYVAKASGRNRIISPADEADPPRPRALLVEDDPAVSSAVRRLLEREGFDVAHFPDGNGVVSAAQAEHFTIAIMDLDLPVIGGFDLVKKLRTLATASKLPILFLTGSDEEDDIVRGFEVGANDYLVKPFHARELIARITRLLPKR
jgi:two-component system, cell cycle response regulator